MLNFLIGAIAGGLMAAVATVAALRNPDVQVRMGIVRPEVPITVARRPEPACPPPPAPTAGAGPGDHADLLFARRRFWSVAPPR